MEFFYPDAKDEQDAEEQIATVRGLQNFGLTDRRIRRLKWRDHNRKRDAVATVGSPDPYENVPVHAILETGAQSGARYLVVTPARGILAMPPIMLGSADDVEFFDGWGSSEPPRRQYGFVQHVGSSVERHWEERAYAPPVHLAEPTIEIEGSRWRVLGRHTPGDTDTPEPWVYDVELIESG